jgi:hypothetical protein
VQLTECAAAVTASLLVFVSMIQRIGEAGCMSWEFGHRGCTRMFQIDNPRIARIDDRHGPSYRVTLLATPWLGTLNRDR